MKDAAQLFKALADETRLRILHLLLKGELCICDLVAVLELPQPKVSRHMAYLKNAGLVTDRRKAVWIYYSIAEPRSAIHACQLRCLSESLEGHEILRQDEARREALVARKTLSCCTLPGAAA
jgi:ArsR family transcriptional regulator